MSDDTPKLRMAAPESAERIARELERERRTMNRQREFGLEQSLAPFRVGSVKALNAVPLTRGLEDQVIYAQPSQLAELLRRDELDAMADRLIREPGSYAKVRAELYGVLAAGRAGGR